MDGCYKGYTSVEKWMLHLVNGCNKQVVTYVTSYLHNNFDHTVTSFRNVHNTSSVGVSMITIITL